MGSEQQYIDLYKQSRTMIHEHSSDVMNSVRDEAFERFVANGFPSKKVERYKYTDIQKLFAPDYGLNLNRLTIPVDPYNAFRCDVPNLSTSLYFVVNDEFYQDEKPKGHLPEGVIIGSLKDFATTAYYNQLAGKAHDATTDLNTMLAQDGYKLTGSNTEKLEKVFLQELINFTMNPNESFVTARRSGYPKIGSTLIPRINFSEVPVTEIPRRFDTGLPEKTDIMYDIVTKAYQDQGFTPTSRGENGKILHNERVWYDKGAPEWGAGQTL